jgi:hypothetical protein
MTQEEAQKIIALFFENLEEAIKSKYYSYLGSVQNLICKLQNKTVGSLVEKVCHIDLGVL